MKHLFTSLLLLSILSMSTISFGGKGGIALSKECLQTIAPDIFKQVKAAKESADSEYKAGFKEFLSYRLLFAQQSAFNEHVMNNEVGYLTLAGIYVEELPVWHGKAESDKHPRLKGYDNLLNDHCKRNTMADYAHATDRALEAIKCIRAGCYVESESKFDFATAYGLAKVSQEEYRDKLDKISLQDSDWIPLQLEGSATLAQILLNELDEENK